MNSTNYYKKLDYFTIQRDPRFKDGIRKPNFFKSPAKTSRHFWRIYWKKQIAEHYNSYLKHKFGQTK